MKRTLINFKNIFTVCDVKIPACRQAGLMRERSG